MVGGACITSVLYSVSVFEVSAKSWSVNRRLHFHSEGEVEQTVFRFRMMVNPWMDSNPGLALEYEALVDGS